MTKWICLLRKRACLYVICCTLGEPCIKWEELPPFPGSEEPQSYTGYDKQKSEATTVGVLVEWLTLLIFIREVTG
jgi:hypothetical protein